MGHEPGATPALLALGLGEVVAEDLREHGIARDLGRAAELGERLLLDGVDVGEVLAELLFERACVVHALRLPAAHALKRCSGLEAVGGGKRVGVRPLRLAIPAVLIVLAMPAAGAAAKTLKPNKLGDHVTGQVELALP